MQTVSQMHPLPQQHPEIPRQDWRQLLQRPAQLHWPVASQVPVVQVPHEPPQPFGPQTLPLQSGVHLQT